MPKSKIGLALGGGAARGWAHIGVIRALADAGIEPDIIAGTSIGAVVGGCYAAGAIDAVEAFALGLTRRKVFGYLDFNLAGNGLITGQRLCKQLSANLGDVRIENLDARFTAIATEIGSGHELWLSRGRLVDAIRASYALPGIFRPVSINGRWLFDGALVNPIPVSVCRAMGATFVIAVNLNADLYSRGTVIPNLSATDDNLIPVPDCTPVPAPPPPTRSAVKLLQRQFFGANENVPGISRVMIDAFNIVQDRIARSRLAGDPPDALISPRLGTFSPFDFHRAEDLIALGRQAVARDIGHILDALQTEPAPPLSFSEPNTAA